MKKIKSNVGNFATAKLQAKMLSILAIIALIVVIGFSMACDGYEDDTTPAHENQWGNWTVTKAATCIAKGEETRTCTLDPTHKEIREIPIDPNGHDWGSLAQTTAPTYTSAGIETRTCNHDAAHKETRVGSPKPFTKIADFKAWLAVQPGNTAATPYTVKLNVSDLGGSRNIPGSVGNALFTNYTKYVSLDLSDSTITSLPCDVNNYYIGAFDECTSLTGVTIGNSVIGIEPFAFYGCTSLTVIIVASDNGAYTSQDGILYNENKTTLIQYPAGKADSAFTIPNGVTSIYWGAFGGSSLTSVNIPNSVTNIGRSAFNKCISLTSITIPNSVTSIGNSAFYYTSLTSVTIGNGVTSIGDSAFYYCTSLTSVTFATGSNITDFGHNAFPGSDNLKDAYSTGKAGTYTRLVNGSTWTKQP